MTILTGPEPAPLPEGLAAQLRRLSFPTLGHYLEEGFVDPGIQRLAGSQRILGVAVTVRITGQDSTLLHHAAGLVGPGQVMVVDTGGDARHAPLGEVVASALAAGGAAGAVVDGVVTDIDELERIGMPVYGRGRSILTTKLLGLDAGGLNVPVVCGGVAVSPGDVVLADRNGVLVAAPGVLAAIVETALEDDAEEPDLLAAVARGERLGDLTGATESLRPHLP